MTATRLDSVEFEKQANAVVVENEPAVDDANHAFAIGLDDPQPMNSGGILLTGWYYGGSEYDTYTVSEVRLVETYADNDTNANDEIIVQTDEVPKALSLEGEPQQGYAKLTRLNVAAACPAALRSQVGDVSATESNAGFMIWLDEWGDLPDGDYKVVAVVLCGGTLHYPSAQLTIRNGEPSIGGAQLRSIAEVWNPPPVEETEEETDIQP